MIQGSLHSILIKETIRASPCLTTKEPEPIKEMIWTALSIKIIKDHRPSTKLAKETIIFIFQQFNLSLLTMCLHLRQRLMQDPARVVQTREPAIKVPPQFRQRVTRATTEEQGLDQGLEASDKRTTR